MLVDPTICARARKTRDPRFDGRFFIGVLTTGIYCRPICPARSPKEENVRYFPTAAAAAEAGLRPCLRCRPESSPGTPAWLGTSATVSRALRLISESALEDGGIDALAARLGIGSRHLRRLFLTHLGASPTAVAQTRRLHFAKKLIDESRLPMREVALASGFGSIRRFNATFQKTYQRTPTHLRRLARQTPTSPENEYRFRLRFRPPFCWPALLEFLVPRATPGVEVVEDGCYRRIFSLNDHIGWIETELDESATAVNLCIRFPEPRWPFLIVERVRRMFDLSADPSQIAVQLRRDPMLAGRLVRAFGTPVVLGNGLTHLFPAPEKLADADLDRIGLPRARAHTIRSLARAVRDKELVLTGVVNVEEFLARFCGLPGIGDWTAQYVAMRALGEPDAFPAGDLGLLRAAGVRNARQLENRAQLWRPWRAYAAMYLWQGAAKEVPKHETNALYSDRESARPVALGG